MNACMKGHLKIVQYLHKNKCDLSMKNNVSELLMDWYILFYCKAGDTPLMVASKYGKFEIVKYLHQSGCELTCKNNVCLLLIDLKILFNF